jgi:hypothetical protein
VLLFTGSKTFSQNQTFHDGLSIVYKYDFADTLSKSRPLGGKYNHVTSHNGKFVLYGNYRCGVVDATGNVIIPDEYMLIVRNGDVFEARKDGRNKLIDTKGVIIGEYDNLIKMSEQLYRARKNKKFGVIDIHGNEIIPIEYEHIGNISNNKTIQIRNRNNQHAIMNEQGKMIVPWYDFIFEDDGLYRVRKGKNWGVVDIRGKEIIPCEYDIIWTDSGLFKVCKNKKWGIVDSGGKMIVPLEYDLLGSFENGFSKATKNGYLGVIDKNNLIIHDFKYAYINPFVNEIAEACECDEFVQAGNQKEVKRYEKKGYVLLKTPTRLMAMCKNPKYSELKIENLNLTTHEKF